MKKGLPERVRRDEPQETALVTQRVNLLCKPVLRLLGHAKPFIFRTDALNYILGAALMHEYDEKYYTLAYGSRKLTSAKRSYSTLEMECLAIVWDVSKFRLYLAGKPFIVQTDHQPLMFLNDAKLKNNRIMLWALALQGYDYTVKDIRRKDNLLADYLSRIVVDLDESKTFCLVCFVVFFWSNNSNRLFYW